MRLQIEAVCRKILIRECKAGGTTAQLLEHATQAEHPGLRGSGLRFCCSPEFANDGLGVSIFQAHTHPNAPVIWSIKEFWLAFLPRTDTLPPMKFTAYSYWWRFTYRNNRQRGAYS